MKNRRSHTPLKSKQRRDFLKVAGGAMAATAFGAYPLRGWAADPVNIGALYPTTGSMAQIGVGCVAAAKLAVEMVNEAGGIKSLGGAKLNLIISDVQSDTTVTRTETDRLISGNKLSAIHGCYASALTLIASEVAERAKVPLITGSSSDQLNKGRTYTFTPFARASQFAKAQLQMSKLVSDKPKVAVIFENTAFGTSTSNGLKELAPGEGVEIVMFEPYSAGFTDASPLINKVKASGANTLFSVSYLNDLILIVRTVKQVGLNIAINGGSGGFVDARLLQECRQARRRPARRGALESRHRRRRPESERRIQEAHRRIPVRIRRRPGRADLHARRRARTGALGRSAEGARGAVDARRLLGLCGDGARRQGEVRSRRQEHLRPPGRRAVAERRSRPASSRRKTPARR